MKRVLRYVRGTSSYSLKFQPGRFNIQALVDADYAGNISDRKSRSGFLVKFGSAICVWASKKQKTVALSTCESEYYALTLAAKETIWIGGVLSEVGLKQKGPSPIRSENQSAIAWATGERCPSKIAKHIDVRIHFIRDLVKAGIIDIAYVPSAENEADVLTKPIGPKPHASVLERLGIIGTMEEEC